MATLFYELKTIYQVSKHFFQCKILDFFCKGRKILNFPLPILLIVFPFPLLFTLFLFDLCSLHFLKMVLHVH